MPEIVILNVKDPRIQLDDFLSQIEEIFLESSTKKDFKDAQEKASFIWKYLGFYLAHYPEYAWVAIKNGKVLGYVLGMPFTQDPSLYSIQPHLKAFEEYFSNYPAHLHINCHHQARGKGVGQLLTLRILEQMKAQGVQGLHIMTGPLSANRHFYTKLGFDFMTEQQGILMMGKSLL
jgi:GNAT superfamily N-acetyltransferase